MNCKVLCAAAVASLAVMGGFAAAEDYPSRPVKFVVPFAAGGGNDIVARIVGEKLGELWKSPVVIENRAGAGGQRGRGVRECGGTGWVHIVFLHPGTGGRQQKPLQANSLQS